MAVPLLFQHSVYPGDNFHVFPHLKFSSAIFVSFSVPTAAADRKAVRCLTELKVNSAQSSRPSGLTVSNFRHQMAEDRSCDDLIAGEMSVSRQTLAVDDDERRRRKQLLWLPCNHEVSAERPRTTSNSAASQVVQVATVDDAADEVTTAAAVRRLLKKISQLESFAERLQVALAVRNERVTQLSDENATLRQQLAAATAAGLPAPTSKLSSTGEQPEHQQFETVRRLAVEQAYRASVAECELQVWRERCELLEGRRWRNGEDDASTCDVAFSNVDARPVGDDERRLNQLTPRSVVGR